LRGIELARSLAKYSAEGEEYVTKLSPFIRQKNATLYPTTALTELTE
jgi:uncharacterized FlgJ-related protein